VNDARDFKAFHFTFFEKTHAAQRQAPVHFTDGICRYFSLVNDINNQGVSFCTFPKYPQRA
jgi:hypothetical protein